MERLDLFVRSVDRTQPLSKISCRLDLRNDSPVPVLPWSIYIRGERQVFRRLPSSTFSVKVNIRSLLDHESDELKAFAAGVRSWPDEVAKDKGRNRWGDCILGFCESAKGEDGFNRGWVF